MTAPFHRSLADYLEALSALAERYNGDDQAMYLGRCEVFLSGEAVGHIEDITDAGDFVFVPA